MDQNYNNSQNDFLWTLLANPANDAQLYNYNLQRLVNDFPQSGILQALLAHSSEEKNLKQASVYFSPRSLYKLINAPATFTGVPNEKIIIPSAIRSNGDYNAPVLSVQTIEETPVVEQLLTDHANAENYFTEHLAEESPAVEEHHAIFSDPEANIHHFSEPAEVLINELPVENKLTEEHSFELPVQEAVKEIHTELPVAENLVEHEEPLPVATMESVLHDTEATDNAAEHISETVAAVVEQHPAENKIEEEIKPTEKSEEHHPEKEIEDETYEEIGGIENIAITPEVNHPQEQKIAEPVEHKDLHAKGSMQEEEDKLLMGSIAATDFFTFEKAFGEKTAEQAEPIAAPAEAPKAADAAADDTEQQDVSKYHDEKMPYTFMWWLDKTRKEYSDTYQPYSKPEAEPVTALAISTKKPTDELQQQYYENIFHITSVEELDKSTAPYAQTTNKFDPKRKEHVIIERFIQEEPQIRPQSSDKLDNENKAKKSSEDRDELVTETLAAIYSDQMLYHKAIASYKKLMLKFPEKSRYFAGKIEQLEKKTN